MSSIDEKRVYSDRREKTVCYLATGVGVASVDVAGDIVGGFSLDHRCTARDLAVLGPDAPAGPAVVVATDEDVLIRALATGDADSDPEYRETGFGPAVAVGVHNGHPVAADPEGRIAGTRGDTGDGRDGFEWTDLGSVPDPRAVDGSLVAAADGIYRRTDDGLTHVGLDAVRDVAAPPGVSPLAATDEGLYRLGPGWTRDLDGSFHAVAAAPGRAEDRTTDGRAHAAGDGFYAREDDDWHPVSLPVEGTVTDVGYAEGIYAITRDGTVLVTVGDGWRSRATGLGDADAIAVPGTW